MTVSLVVKAPVPGLVKTRLARTVGTKEAARIFRLLVEHQIQEIPKEFDLRVDGAPHEHFELLRQWIRPLRTNVRFYPQAEGDLGNRLQQIVSHHFNSRPDPLLLLGGDCPGCNTSLLLQAREFLLSKDTVLGPASDGGYYLLGLNSANASCFEGIPWSTAGVLQLTRERLAAEGLTTGELPALYDVDTEAEWRKAQREFGLS